MGRITFRFAIRPIPDNPAWSYALHAVTGPVATSVFPLAVNPGTTAHLEVRGPGEDRSAVDRSADSQAI